MATAADLVERRFDQVLPGPLWVTDSTEHPTGEARCPAGWSWRWSPARWWLVDRPPPGHPLVPGSLGMAITHRNPGPDQSDP